MLDSETQKDSLARMKKIEGQIKGIEGMIESKRYCIDIINQITAVKRALDSLGMVVLRRHVDSCVREAMHDGLTGREKIDELIKSVYDYVR